MEKKRGAMRSPVLICLLLSVDIAAAQELLDPRERDEDLSDTEVTVEVSRTDSDLYEYRYQLDAGDGNKGKITTFMVALECSEEFSDYTLPEQETGGYVMGVVAPGEPPEYTPAVVYFGGGTSHGISRSRYALWSVDLEPGASISGMRVVSPAKPGMRTFILKPALPTGIYDYDSLPDDVTEMDLPQGEDFEVTGLIEGPECPGVTPPPERPRFHGRKSTRPDGREHLNSLLSYSAPLRDRMTVGSDQENLSVTIHYHEHLEPDTFRVEPDHFRSRFAPEPGSSETVALPLNGPINKFRFKVRGSNSAGRGAWDEDLFEVRARGEADSDSDE